MSKEIKAIRGQLRQIAKEILPEVMASEIVGILQAEQRAKLTEIANMVVKRLDEIENRSKDVQSYIMREVANQTAPKQEETNEQA